jgi:disulfide bond formation protein DsbB
VTETASLVLAAGAAVIQVLLTLLLIVAAAALVFPGARRVLREIRATFLGSELWVAWGIALIATLGSMYFSEVAHYVPCRLCWFQRIAMYPLVVILLVAALRKDTRGGALYGLAFPVVGGLVSLYHLYIEANPEAESTSCKIGAPCSTKWIDEFGYVTIPMLALTAFLAIGALLLFARSRSRSPSA